MCDKSNRQFDNKMPASPPLPRRNDDSSLLPRASCEESHRIHVDNWVKETCENLRGESFNRGSSSNPNWGIHSAGDMGTRKESVTTSKIPGATSAFPGTFDKRPSLSSGFKKLLEATTSSVTSPSRDPGVQASAFRKPWSSIRPFEDVLPKVEDGSDGLSKM